MAGMGFVAAAPGGSIAVPVIVKAAKKVDVEMMPSAFQDNAERGKRKNLYKMIGWLAKRIFNTKAKALGKKASSDPRLTAVFEKYEKDTIEFKAELKRLGLTSTEDLKNAINKDPNLKPFVDI